MLHHRGLHEKATKPTAILDIAHQIDLIDLLSGLNAQGLTIVAVLHDVNQACRYASHLVAMKGGASVAHGKPDESVCGPRTVRLLNCLPLKRGWISRLYVERHCDVRRGR